MNKITLKAEARKLTGHKVKNLRKQGIVPANIYGKDVKSLSIEVDAKEFREVYKKAGETGIVTLSLGKASPKGEASERPVLVHNVQVHPATGEILHVDFMQVNLKVKITAQIPVEVTGESPVEKSGEGTVVILLRELEVEALPADLPEKFEIDAAKLTEVDQTVKVADLKVDKAKVEIKADAETILVKVEPPQKEEVVEVVPVTEVPTEGEAAAPAEGEASTEATGNKEEKPQEEKKS